MAGEIKETKEKEIKEREIKQRQTVAQLPEGLDFPPDLIGRIVTTAGRDVLPGTEAKLDRGALKGLELSKLYRDEYSEEFLRAYLASLTPQQKEDLYWFAFNNGKENLCLLLIEMGDEEFLNRGLKEEFQPVIVDKRASIDELLYAAGEEDRWAKHRGATKLYMAVIKSNYLVAQALLETEKVSPTRSFDPRLVLSPRHDGEQDSERMTPLHLAVLKGDEKMVLAFLDGSVIQAQVQLTFSDHNKYGETPLQTAVRKAVIVKPAGREVYLKIIVHLIAAGADPEQRTLPVYGEPPRTSIEFARAYYEANEGDNVTDFIRQVTAALTLPSPQALDAKTAKLRPLITPVDTVSMSSSSVSLASAASLRGFMSSPTLSPTLSTSNPTPSESDRKPERKKSKETHEPEPRSCGIM